MGFSTAGERERDREEREREGGGLTLISDIFLAF